MKKKFLLIVFLLFLLSCGGVEETDNDSDEMTDMESNDDENSIEFPWTDPHTGLVWSVKNDRYGVKHDSANYFCKNMKENEKKDWRIPTISELRTLIKNCSKTETTGQCKASDSCQTSACITASCGGCENSSDGRYSKLGDTGWYWSSTRVDGVQSGNLLFVGFSAGYVNKAYEMEKLMIRCVLKEE